MRSEATNRETLSEHISAVARGCDWDALAWDVLIFLLTDDEYSAAVEEGTLPGPGGTMRALEQHRAIVVEVLDSMADRTFVGRKTNAYAMHLIAKRLRQDGIDVPRCWFALAKILWRGGEARATVDGALIRQGARGRILF